MTPFRATLVATIEGLLTASYTSQLAFFTVVFAVIYGLLVDGLISIFRARAGTTEISAGVEQQDTSSR